MCQVTRVSSICFDCKQGSQSFLQIFQLRVFFSQFVFSFYPLYRIQLQSTGLRLLLPSYMFFYDCSLNITKYLYFYTQNTMLIHLHTIQPLLLVGGVFCFYLFVCIFIYLFLSYLLGQDLIVVRTGVMAQWSGDLLLLQKPRVRSPATT